MGLFKRAVFQFSHPEVRKTWTESLYYGNGTALITDVRDAAKTLLFKRVKMLARGVRILNAYVSDDDFVRDSLPVNAPTPTADGTWNKDLITDSDTETLADFPWVTLLLRMRAGTRTTKNSFISGIPDFGTSTAAPAKVNNGKWTDAYDAWVKELKDTWAWKGINTSPTDNPIIKIVGITSANNLLTFTTFANHGLNVGDEVSVHGAKVLSGKVSGTFKVKAPVTGDTFTADQKGDAGVQYVRGGTAQKRTEGLLTIQEVIVRGITDKKRGDSVGRRPGRRKTRRS